MIIALAQINPTLGDFQGNKQKILEYWINAADKLADIVVFPELAISGYNPCDLILRKSFVEESQNILMELVEESKNISTSIIIGSVISENDKIFNSAFMIHNGKILHRHDKISLPNYGVFDEKRLFSRGHCTSFIEFKGKKILLLICEDIWQNNHILSGMDYIIVLNASPYEVDKHKARISLLQEKSVKYSSDILYVNMVGCQDSVIYDGGSIMMSKFGDIIHQSPFFEESLTFTGQMNPINKAIDKREFIYNALLLSIKDYTRKNNITDVLIGLSGGIDSTFVTMLAIDALGKDRVHIVTLPSRYSSQKTYEDSNLFLTNITKEHKEISIEPLFKEAMNSLHCNKDITEQNLQSRIRGMILMAISNENNYMLLSTSNKSELAIGYSTLYGDMNGGFNPLKDLYKRDIYALSRWRNEKEGYDIIPESIIAKAPSAELKHNQQDNHDLPEYEALDEILYQYIECGKSRSDIINNGFSIEIVDKILKLIRIAQFKRNQATLGPKIRNMSFDLDWRYPVTNKFWQ